MRGNLSIRSDPFSAYLLLTSLLGLCLVAIAVSTLQVQTLEADFSWRRPLIGLGFGFICLLGIAAALCPSRCSHIFHFKKENEKVYLTKNEPTNLKDLAPQLRGHHPDCGRFSAHVLRFGRKILCAGCFGLTIGAAVSLLGTSLYFFTASPLPISRYPILLGTGFACVALGLLQYHLLDFGKNSVHMLLNILFVAGAFLLLVSVDALIMSLSADFYLLALNVFWVFARIELSRKHHQIICENCSLETCPLRLRL